MKGTTLALGPAHTRTGASVNVWTAALVRRCATSASERVGGDFIGCEPLLDAIEEEFHRDFTAFTSPVPAQC